MREDICTIPVSDAFEENDGCPVCRMYDTVEKRILEYIMGAAMMEPDVRIATNEVGFCGKHFKRMLKMRGRLSLALMLQTHTEEVRKNITEANFLVSSAKRASRASELMDSCFVCEKINWGFQRMLDTIYRTYENDREFRELFGKQDYYCFNHYAMLVNGSNRKNMKRWGDDFVKSLEEKATATLKGLQDDLDHYCRMYDYRNSGENADWGNSKDSVERTIAFLTGDTEVLD